MDDSFRLFIAEGRTAPVLRPVSEKPRGQVPVPGVADTEAAVAAAASGLLACRARSAFDRADALRAFADVVKWRSAEAAGMTGRETGKPIAPTGCYRVLSVDEFRRFAEKVLRIYGPISESRALAGRVDVHPAPVGIAALIARKLAPALAAAVSMRIRPAMVLVDCCRAGAVPADSVSLVLGPTEAASAPIMAAKSGSARVGQPLIRHAAATLKRVSMDRGGQAPLIIHHDADCTDDRAVMTPEYFGPIAAINRFARDDEVLSQANASDLGLAARALTHSPKRARRLVAAVQAGMVGITSFAMAAEAPFGAGPSGMGRAGGIVAKSDYLDVKSSRVVGA